MKNESILSKLNDLQPFDFSTFRMPTALAGRPCGSDFGYFHTGCLSSWCVSVTLQIRKEKKPYKIMIPFFVCGVDRWERTHIWFILSWNVVVVQNSFLSSTFFFQFSYFVSWGTLENPLNWSILLSGRKEIKRDVQSSGEWNGQSSTSNPELCCSRVVRELPMR